MQRSFHGIHVSTFIELNIIGHPGSRRTGTFGTKKPSWLLPLLTMLGLCTAVPVSYATENGNEEFPIGVNTVLPGVEPPLGETEYLNYTNFYDVGSSVGPNGDKAAPGFHLNVVANAFRVLHSWDIKEGPFWFTSGVVAPLVNVNLRVAGQHSSDTTLADLDLQVLYLNYANKTHTVFAFAGLDVYVPTSHYNKNDLVNIGLNYTTFMPNGAVSWFISKRLQASLDVNWQVPTENNSTHYQSGQSVDFDWGVDYGPIKSAPRFFVGLQGYAYQQITDDTQFGSAYNDGNYGRVIAIGPQLRYDIKGGGIALKYQHEFAVENHSKGEKVWFQLALPVRFL